VRKDTGNRFLLRILKNVPSVRSSSRYPHFLKVRSADYRRALTMTLLEEAGEMADLLGVRGTLDDLRARIEDPSLTASGKLGKGILEGLNARDPLAVKATDFNAAAERYYRDDLCRKQMREALSFLEEDFAVPPAWKEGEKTIVKSLLGERDPVGFLRECVDDVLFDSASTESLEKLMGLVILSIHHDTVEAGASHEQRP